MRGEGEGPDAHRAFEVAAEHVAKRLRRYRRRVNDHARSLAEERADAAETAPEYVVSQADGEAGEEDGTSAPAAANGADNGVIVAEQPAEIARLTLSEAVMRLDLAQMAALPFRNSGSGAINLVYRRSDGCIGWIDLPAR